MSELRRSCNFCRQRRMKCDGELPWCSACNERSIPCVYESIGARGRPRRKSSASEPILTSPKQVGSSKPKSKYSPELASDLPAGAEFAVAEGSSLLTVGQAMLMTDRQLWSSFLVHYNNRSGILKVTLEGVKPSRILMTMMEQLIQLACGNPSISNGPTSNASHIMAPLPKLSVEATKPIVSTPILMHLIDLAFTCHPFAALVVSKTSLLYDHRDGVAHPALLLFLAAEGLQLGVPDVEAMFANGDLPNVETLMEQGEIELRNSVSSFTNSLVVTANCQSLLLLSFRMLATSHIRRGVVYLSLCCQTLDSILERRSQTNVAEVKMNGVQMARMEEELLQNIYWLVSSLSLWVTLQLPHTLAGLRLNHQLNSANYPVLDSYRSALYQLDLMSSHLTVLKPQQESSKQLFCLATVNLQLQQRLHKGADMTFSQVNLTSDHTLGEVSLAVSISSRLMAIKSCFGPASATHKTRIGSGKVQQIVDFAIKTLEASASVCEVAKRSSRATEQSIAMQMTTIRLYVDTMSSLAAAIEMFFALSFPPSYSVQDDHFERFELAETEPEVVDYGKWQIYQLLQSFTALLNEEHLSCPQRSAVRTQLSRLAAAVQQCLQVNAVDASSRSISVGLESPTDNNNTVNRFIDGRRWPTEEAAYSMNMTTTTTSTTPRYDSNPYDAFGIHQSTPLLASLTNTTMNNLLHPSINTAQGTSRGPTRIDVSLHPHQHGNVHMDNVLQQEGSHSKTWDSTSLSPGGREMLTSSHSSFDPSMSLMSGSNQSSLQVPPGTPRGHPTGGGSDGNPHSPLVPSPFLSDSSKFHGAPPMSMQPSEGTANAAVTAVVAAATYSISPPSPAPPQEGQENLW